MMMNEYLHHGALESSGRITVARACVYSMLALLWRFRDVERVYTAIVTPCSFEMCCYSRSSLLEPAGNVVIIMVDESIRIRFYCFK